MVVLVLVLRGMGYPRRRNAGVECCYCCCSNSSGNSSSSGSSGSSC